MNPVPEQPDKYPTESKKLPRYRHRFNNFIKKNLLDQSQSDRVKSISVGVGMFSSILPLWGWQTLIAIGLSFIFKLNKALTVGVSAISFTPLLPVFIYLSFLCGSLITGNNSSLNSVNQIDLTFIKDNFLQYFWGAWVLALGMGALSGLITFILLKTLFRKRMRAFKNKN